MKLKTKSVAQLKKEGIAVSSWAEELSARLPKPPKEDVEMEIVSLAELGFTEAASLQDILKAGRKAGLLPCAHLGPNFPFEVLQPNEYIWIAMEPIVVSGGWPDVFQVLRGAGGRWLFADDAAPDDRWYPDDRFAFRKSLVSDTQPSDLGALALRLSRVEEILRFHNLTGE